MTMNANSRLIVCVILTFFFVAWMISPVLATEGRRDVQKDDRDDDSRFSEEGYSHFVQEGYDEMHHCKSPIPDSFTAIGELTIDSSLIGATPHWFLLAAGKTEQRVLLNYINHAEVTQQKRAAWARFMKTVWMKYPVKYVKAGTSSKLVPGISLSRFSPTSRENAIFQEIEQYIAEDMEKVVAKTDADESNSILPQWAKPEHSSFASIACQKEKVPSDLTTIMTTNAPIPDDWYNYPGGFLDHSLDHGYIPYSGIGNAPFKCNNYASVASTNYASHRYEAAFTNLGYSSHFMEDLGNPFHTPQIQIIALQYIEDPTYWKLIAIPKIGVELVNYQAIHDNYEGFVNTFWEEKLPSYVDPNMESFSDIANSVTDYASISNPSSSAQQLAEESWKMSPDLFWDCYMRFIKTRMYDFENDTVIVIKTKNRVLQTERYTRGLVRYITGGQPLMISITGTAGQGGSITPTGTISVPYGTIESYIITANLGYVIDDVKVDGTSIGGSGKSSYQATVLATLSDHTISATFKPVAPPSGGNLPCPAGTPFDSSKYRQNTPQSDPMVFTCSWDGTGRVYISGDKTALTGIWADDGYTISIQPSGATFETPVHFAYQHPPIELTSGMRPGPNTFTLVVVNWNRLSMSYGSSTGVGTDQTPYIIQLNSPMAGMSLEEPSIEEPPNVILNETVEETTEAGIP